MEVEEDLFWFQLHTGLSHCDAMDFNQSWIRSLDGKRYINSTRCKTDSEFIVPLLPEALAVMIKYNYRLSRMCNLVYNKCIKLLQDRARVATLLTTQVARSTFGQNMLDLGIPIETVSRMLAIVAPK